MIVLFLYGVVFTRPGQGPVMMMLMEDKVTEVKKTLVCHEKSR